MGATNWSTNYTNWHESTIGGVNCFIARICKYEKELAKNGYEVVCGKWLVDYELGCVRAFGDEADFVTKSYINLRRLLGGKRADCRAGHKRLLLVAVFCLKSSIFGCG